MNTGKFIMAIVVLVAGNVILSENAEAFSYTLTEGYPEELAVYFRTKPNTAVRPGDDFTVEIIIKNSSSKPFPGVKVRLLPQFSPPLGLRAVDPHPATLNNFYSSTINYNVDWFDQIIPAKGEKRYSITYRLHPGSADPDMKISEQFYLEIRPIVASTFRVTYYELPISTALGNRAPYNSSIADNIFYAAAGRFPTSAEHAKWTKVLKSLGENPGTCVGTQSCNKGSFLLKQIKDELAKASAAASKADVKSIFQSVYGRLPTATEETYWKNRLFDKPDATVLKGAMYFQKARGRTIGK